MNNFLFHSECSTLYFTYHNLSYVFFVFCLLYRPNFKNHIYIYIYIYTAFSGSVEHQVNYSQTYTKTIIRMLYSCNEQHEDFR